MLQAFFIAYLKYLPKGLLLPKVRTGCLPNGEDRFLKSTTRLVRGLKAVAAPIQAAPGAKVQEGAVGEGLLTEQERRQTLDQLPSLGKNAPVLEPAGPPRSGASGLVVDAGALPPPAPLPPLEPAAGDVPVDRGLPIPDQYGLDRVVALVRDPHWLFVYWELKGGLLERLRFQYTSEVVDQARWALRVDAMPFSQRTIVDIDLQARHWYLRVAPEGCYRIELGFFNPDGNFETLCRSGEIHTPRNAPAAVLDECWGVAKEDLERLLRAGGAVLQADSGTGGAEGVGSAFQRLDPPRAAAFFSGRWSR